jgi:hypothetical protein
MSSSKLLHAVTTQSPALHPVLQARPQPPQLAELVCSSTQALEQHVPPVHVMPSSLVHVLVLVAGWQVWHALLGLAAAAA